MEGIYLKKAYHIIRMSPMIQYLICGLVIIILLLIIYYYKDKFTVVLPIIPPEVPYSNYKLEYPGSDVKTVLQEYVDTINNPPATISSSSSSPSTISPSIVAPLPTSGNDANAVAKNIKQQLKGITEDYFKKGIKPAIEIDNWINNLNQRLTNIQLKLVELNIKPNQELVFY